MTTRKRILLPRSDIPGRAPTINEIDFGEIAINTHDGKLRLLKEKTLMVKSLFNLLVLKK